ncbi:glucosidase II [Rhizina undulata]
MRRKALALKGIVPFLLLSLSFPHGGLSVKHENFKTCAQSGFCKRAREYADRAVAAGPSWVSPYELDEQTIKLDDGVLTGTVWKTIISEDVEERVELPLKFSFLENGIARVTIDEAKRINGDIELRHDSKARKERYNEAENWVLVGGKNFHKDAKLQTKDGVTRVIYGPAGLEAQVQHKPFGIKFIRDGEPQVIFNEHNLLNIEHWRPYKGKRDGEVKEGEEPPAAAEDEGTWWEEKFGGNTDSKPRGPESVGLDITFPGYEHVYGIPEHASSLALKETRGGEGNYDEPYRLYNADVFEYIVDSPMTLYGAIPFMQAQKKGSTIGVFWLNAAETWVDIVKDKRNPNSLSTEKRSTHTHWFSESGQLDVFVLPGPNSSWLYKQYGELTGFTALPPTFATAYHQCRWNYVSQDDVKDVDRKFDKFDIPYDVIWLDIEYTDGKKYFTWDPLTFGDPLTMQKTLAKRDRKLVGIIDPHIKNDKNYAINNEMLEKGLAVKDKTGDKTYEGWCWPGSSHWVDCFNPAAVQWWKSLFAVDKFIGSAANMFIWNDMNEPSVFNGPETTMPKDNLHHGNWEHRDVHNLNGMTLHNATWEALKGRFGPENEKRPFVLTRSFFAGSQRSSAMWTGDNLAEWSHLQQAFPMLLSQGIAGFPFAGADVGGFFGNPSKELLTRWYQAGAFYPFFRAHAHIDAKRREPYLVGEPYVSIIRDAIRLRYSLLPAWYTAFHRASWEGMPILRPHFVMFPDDPAGFEIDDQFFLGDTGLLVKPVVTEVAQEQIVYIPDEEPYYDYADYTVYRGKGVHKIPAPLAKTPILMRGGHIIPRRDRPRRSSGLMKFDPFTLVVALNYQGVAGGVLYLDDGETFAYKSGAYIHRSFVFTENTLRSGNLNPQADKAKEFEESIKEVRVEKVIIVGVGEAWIGREKVVAKQGEKRWDVEVKVEEKEGTRVATLRDPAVKIGADWTIGFE